ncbi:MAG: ATP-binding protein [Nanoarchaeota archaeon]|nr:ATP-binding protein [Nanoarchaeota archaeon]
MIPAIKDSLLLQKREIESKLKEDYVEREARLKSPDKGIINVIIGPRRAGKSFFAMRALHALGNFGYANFDDEKLVSVEDYGEIIAALGSIYSSPKYLLLDEIQNLSKWELFVNRLQRQGYNLVITGSNSHLLSRELSTHLTGRHLLVNVFPFSFSEFLKLEKKELTSSEKKEKLAYYLVYGGYPEPLIKKLDYKDYLSTLFNSIILKDIVRRYRIRAVDAIDDLASYLISNIAKEFSYTSLSKLTKCRSPVTVEKYISYFEEALIFFRISKFSFKLKEQIDSNKKIYCTDNGLIHAKAFKISNDTGRLFENLAAIELKKREISGEAEVYFWKNTQQEEVDFVVKRGHKVEQLIQACQDISDAKTKEREIRALLKAGEELKCNKLVILTGDYEAEENAEWFGIKAKISFVPLWKWLPGISTDI